MKYEVNIIYMGQINYIVEADTKEEAEDLARTLWSDDSPGDSLGTEWDNIDRIESKPLEDNMEKEEDWGHFYNAKEE